MSFDERYRAIESRDTRFDGQFVTAVRTTGIYCRPSCPARTPKPANVTFYATSAAAHEAGYRACKRCLPEAAPGLPCMEPARRRRSARHAPDRRRRRRARGRSRARPPAGVLVAAPHAAAHGGARRRPRSRSPGRTARTPRACCWWAPSCPWRTSRSRRASRACGSSTTRCARSSGCTPLELRARRPPRRRATPVGRAGRRSTSCPAAPRTRSTPPACSRGCRRGRSRASRSRRPTSFARTLRLAGRAGVVRAARRRRRPRATARDASPASAICRRSSRARGDCSTSTPIPSPSTRRSRGMPELAPLVAAPAGHPRARCRRSRTRCSSARWSASRSPVAAARTALTRAHRRACGETPSTSRSTAPTRLFPTMAAIAERGARCCAARPRASAPSSAPPPRSPTARSTLTPGDDAAEQRAALLAMPGIGPWTADYVRMRVTGDPDVFLPGDVAVRAGAAALGLPPIRAGAHRVGRRTAPVASLPHRAPLARRPPAGRPADRAGPGAARARPTPPPTLLATPLSRGRPA